jgi:DNA-binding transcriptional regulator YiaG
VAKLESILKETIARGSRREVRRAVAPLRRDVRRLRQLVRDLRDGLTAVRDVAAQWKRVAAPTSWRPDVSEEQARAARLSPGLIRKLRDRLALSQAGLARLVGVSPAAVVQWEAGRAAPAGPNRRRLIGLRGVGRREVKRMLASATPTRRAATTPNPRRRRTTKTAKTK